MSSYWLFCIFVQLGMIVWQLGRLVKALEGG